MSTFDDFEQHLQFSLEESADEDNRLAVELNHRSQEVFVKVVTQLTKNGMQGLPTPAEIGDRSEIEFLLELQKTDPSNQEIATKMYIISGIVHAVCVYMENDPDAVETKRRAQFEILEADGVKKEDSEIALSVLNDLVPIEGLPLDDDFALDYELGKFKRVEMRQSIAKEMLPYAKVRIDEIDPLFAGNQEVEDIKASMELMLSSLLADSQIGPISGTLDELLVDSETFDRYYSGTRAWGLDIMTGSHDLRDTVEQAFIALRDLEQRNA